MVGGAGGVGAVYSDKMDGLSTGSQCDPSSMLVNNSPKFGGATAKSETPCALNHQSTLNVIH